MFPLRFDDFAAELAVKRTHMVLSFDCKPEREAVLIEPARVPFCTGTIVHLLGCWDIRELKPQQLKRRERFQTTEVLLSTAGAINTNGPTGAPLRPDVTALPRSSLCLSLERVCICLIG